MNELVEQALHGRRRAIARLITQVENDPSAAKEAIMTLYRHTGRAHIVGVTGPPGSGKSTLVNEIAKEFRLRSTSVGIVAVDPSSPFTGGALLGDRVRMRDLSGDSGIFIRSMASRGRLGGLARATGDVVKVLDAAGFGVILIETVGAGQAEVDIANAGHTTLVIEAPGMGDEVQTIKAGILEIADVLVVNKADRPGSNRTVKALKAMLQLGSRSMNQAHHGTVMPVEGLASNGKRSGDSWSVRVLETVATEGEGISRLVDVILAHKSHLDSSGEWEARELAKSRLEIDQMLQAEFLDRLNKTVPLTEREGLIDAVAKRDLDPYSAVAKLFAHAAQKE